MLNRLFRRNAVDRHAVARLYMDVVEAARRPVFFDEGGVPDSVAGRFDMIVLHAFLVFRRLKSGDEGARAFAQALFDHMFADIDYNLRELGVGDLSVGKKVKAMASDFYGRVSVYEQALDAADDAALVQVLQRNLYDGEDPGPGRTGPIQAMAAYMKREDSALAARPIDGLLAGTVTFGPPPAFPPEGEISHAGP